MHALISLYANDCDLQQMGFLGGVAFWCDGVCRGGGAVFHLHNES